MNHHTRAAALVLTTGGLLSAAATFETTASADQPIKQPIDDTPFTLVSEDICDFPVEVTSTVTGHELVFFDREGRVQRVIVHATEIDVFSAHGESLTSLPYTYTGHVLFDEEGEVVEVQTTGVLVKVPLPDGSTFVGAGRIDFVETGVDFAVRPTTGGSHNYEAFCAALS